MKIESLSERKRCRAAQRGMASVFSTYRPISHQPGRAAIRTIIQPANPGAYLRRLMAACFMISVATSALSAPQDIAVPVGGTISTEGDSLTYGMDISPNGKSTQINGATFTRSTNPYPEALMTDLKGCATVVNRGFPGDRSVDGLVRWQNAPGANLVVMMYGSNDANDFGRSATGIVSPDVFTQVMQLMITRRQAQGSTVMLLIPPPIEDRYFDGLIEPYRAEVRSLGKAMNLLVLDPKDALSSVKSVFTFDHVHLSAAANLAIAKAVASHIKCGGAKK